MRGQRRVVGDESNSMGRQGRANLEGQLIGISGLKCCNRNMTTWRFPIGTDVGTIRMRLLVGHGEGKRLAHARPRTYVSVLSLPPPPLPPSVASIDPAESFALRNSGMTT